MSRNAERAAWTSFAESRIDAQSTPHRVTSINFTVDCKGIPQGSMSGICTTKPDGTPVTILKADNPRTHPYRREVGFAALRARAAAGVHEVFAGPNVPVRVSITFVFERPKSAPASRIYPAYKPDLDKLTRATMDGMTGILYADDAQVVHDEHWKIYGVPARVQICVQLVEEHAES